MSHPRIEPKGISSTARRERHGNYQMSGGKGSAMVVPAGSPAEPGDYTLQLA